MSVQIRRRSPVSDDHLPASIDPTLKQVYAVRGITTEQQLERSAKALLHYKDMSGIDQAVSILATALAEGKRIIIVGDFDADGATSTALSMLALGMMGSKNHDYLVPNRFDFGYGLSPEIVNVAYEQGAQVIMTVDNGIACFAGVERAKELGITVLVTDHHLAAESLPIADAIVNPNQPNCAFMSKNLAGVGVAFYLMLALRAHLRQINWFSEHNITVPNLAELLDIVALGTVADVVPLDENNRILVHQGLLRIRSDKCRPGIQALIDVAGRDKRKMVASDLGFVIGPRLNAAGRLDDMSMGIECLLTDSDYKAKQIAVELDSLNRERREIEQSMQQEAVATLENLQLSEENMPHGLILYQADFHQGVIGILAGRIKEKYFRPTIAFAHQDDAILKGSARSIPGVHIRDLLEELSTRYPGIIIKFGGHAMAAGLSIELAKLTEFTQRFTQLAEEHLAGQPLAGELISDGEIPASSMTLNFCQILKDAGPWGQGFPEPLFDGEFELVEQRIVGQKHLKMMLRLTTGKLIDGIAFNVDTNIWPNTHCKRVELAYKLDINEFRGRTSLQFLIEGINPL